MSLDVTLIDVPIEDRLNGSIPETVNLPRDTIPETANVEYPCRRCGREAGPYKGRGRKPTMCVECKPNRSGQGAPRVSGSTATLAAQATEVLSQINAMIALGLAGFQMFGTAGAIAAHDQQFKAQAYAALTTDPALCQFILKGGAKSAKVSLLLAYGSLALAVAPTAKEEITELRAARQAKRDAEEQG